MPLEKAMLPALIERELAKVKDERVVSHVRTLLMPPKPQMRPWGYGEVGDKFECWIVAADETHDTAIAYCDQGFGPKSPWGLLWLKPEGQLSHMGMDSGWFRHFMDAFFESTGALSLPIWRVVQGALPRLDVLSDEMSWEDAWARAEVLRQSDPKRKVWVHHSIPYG